MNDLTASAGGTAGWTPADAHRRPQVPAHVDEPGDNPREDPLFDFFDHAVGSLFRAAHEAIVMTDEQQKIVAVNPAAETMFRCPAAHMLGESLQRFIPPGHRTEHASQVREFVASETLRERVVPHRRVFALRADGSQFPVLIALSRVDAVVGGGVQRHVAALLLDVSEQSKLKAELGRFKHRLRSIFELAPVAIWICEDDRIVFGNHVARQLFGANHRLIGEPVYALLNPESHDALRQQVRRALSAQTDVATVRGCITRPDGVQRQVEIAVAALPDHGRTTVQMVVADVTEQRRESSELEQSRESLRQLSSSVVEAREEERRRIARELHDELGQRLTALKMDLSALAGAPAPASHQDRIDGMLTMLDDTLAALRRISSDLRPLMLDDLGLNAAIEWLARDTGRRMGIAVTVELGEADPPVHDRVATAVYRMVQEALTNVARHARASAVQITLKHTDDELELTVEDNGTGFAQQANPRAGSFGLLGMRERAGLLGGRLELGNAPGGGARLTVRLPLSGLRQAPATPRTGEGP